MLFSGYSGKFKQKRKESGNNCLEPEKKVVIPESNKQKLYFHF